MIIPVYLFVEFSSCPTMFKWSVLNVKEKSSWSWQWPNLFFWPAISCYLLKHNLCDTYAVRILPKVHSNHIWARFLGVSNSRDFWSVWGLFFSSRAYYLIHIYQLFFLQEFGNDHIFDFYNTYFFILVKYFPAGVWRLCASAKALHRRWVRGGRRAWTQSQAWGRFEHYNDDEDDDGDYEVEEEELDPKQSIYI